MWMKYKHPTENEIEKHILTNTDTFAMHKRKKEKKRTLNARCNNAKLHIELEISWNCSTKMVKRKKWQIPRISILYIFEGQVEIHRQFWVCNENDTKKSATKKIDERIGKKICIQHHKVHIFGWSFENVTRTEQRFAMHFVSSEFCKRSHITPCHTYKSTGYNNNWCCAVAKCQNFKFSHKMCLIMI